jgi:hypothetical protein
MSDAELTSIFDQFVLGKDDKDLLIHTGEDDAALPASYFFSDALFAHSNLHDYLQRPIYCIGRQTYDLRYHLDLKTLLKHPSLVFKSTQWSNIALPGAMKGLLTKPKFCLPFPFGNEECHVMAPMTYYDPFHQPLLHLSGTRFPKKLYPTTPYDGLVDYLEKLLPYMLQTIMTEDLIDHIRIGAHHGILPWNDKELKKRRPFKSLDDLWEFANSAETIEEIKKRFWTNFVFAFQDIPPKGYMFASGLRPLTQLPSSAGIPAALLKFYQKIQRDACLLLDFAGEVAKSRELSRVSNEEFQLDAHLTLIQTKMEKRHHIKFSQTKLTKGLQLILQWINSLKSASIRHTK